MIENAAVIIPVYNEGKVIRNVIEKVLKIFPNVVCIDDGSSDDSSSEINKTRAKLVMHPFNMGQGAALQTGIEYALQDESIKYFVTFDADGQHSIDDVVRMLETLKSKKLDIVLGSRFLGKTENIPKTKKFILRAAVRFTNFTSGLRLTDTHNGLRVFNRHTAETLNITMPDMAHGSEIIERIAKMNYKYTEVPVTIAYTEYSKSKGQSMINAVNIGLDMLINRIIK